MGITNGKPRETNWSRKFYLICFLSDIRMQSGEPPGKNIIKVSQLHHQILDHSLHKKKQRTTAHGSVTTICSRITVALVRKT